MEKKQQKNDCMMRTYASILHKKGIFQFKLTQVP
jgi:hypothetical protein